MEVSDMLFSLMRSVLAKKPIEKQALDCLSIETLSAVYRLSDRHDMAHMVGAALLSYDQLQQNETTEKLQKKMWLAVSRYERIRYELERICDTLEQAKVPFVLLKGAVVRRYYPEPWWRTSCDIDILVHEQDIERAVLVLKETLQYTSNGKKSYHDVSLFSKNNVHLELHFNLKEGQPRLDNLLVKAWEYAVPTQGKTYQHEFTDAYLKFHIVAHMAYHFLSGGCGIKPILDLWLLDKKIADDTVFDELLKQSGLTTFTQKVRKLGKAWFENEMMDSVSLDIQQYIFSGGVYGTTKNKVIVQQQRKGGKTQYLFSKLIISREFLESQYPVLKKHRWLSPVMQVCRWFRLLFCGGIERSKRQAELNFQTDAGQAQKIKQLLADIGLH